MNWSAISFDWNHIRAFLATADEGSLSAAARVLGQSQPTLSRQIAALEVELGVVLFERVGRGLALAPAGRDLLGHVRVMGEAAGQISLVASGHNEAVEGTVSITASDSVSVYILPRILGRLRQIAPGLTIDVVSANDIRDLQRREADIAIRHVQPDQPDLIARLLRETSGHLYASQDYIEARGRPDTVQALAEHAFIGFQPLERFLQQMDHFGLPIAADQIAFSTESGLVAWEMVRLGLGLGVSTREIAGLFDDVEQILPNHPPIPVPLWLTCHRELHTSKRIRLVYDFLAEALSASK